MDASLPKIRRNAYATLTLNVNPKYSLTVVGTGTARMEGTNDVVVVASGGGGSGSSTGNKPYAYDPAPSETATWTPLITQAGSGTNEVAVAAGDQPYAFIRLVVVANGTGEVTSATVVWD